MVFYKQVAFGYQLKRARSRVEENADTKRILAARVRPTSTNDLSKVKFSKSTATPRKPETKTIAVQASIWMGPINPIRRTVTALQESESPSVAVSTDKYVPYIGYLKRTTNRAKTELDKITPLSRARTHVETHETNSSAQRQKSDIKLSKSQETPRATLATKIKSVDHKSLSHYSAEFEKLHPFPMEGNPNSYEINTNLCSSADKLLVPTFDKMTKPNVDTKGTTTKANELIKTGTKTNNSKNDNATTQRQKESQKGDQKTVDFGDTKVTIINLPPTTVVKREKTFSTEKSRPSTTEGRLGGDGGSGLGLEDTYHKYARKSSSARNSRERTELRFSYHSPYAMTPAQRAHMDRKRVWVRDKMLQTTHRKQELQERQRQENELAFEKWLKKKKESKERLASTYSRTKAGTLKRRASNKNKIENQPTVEATKKGTLEDDSVQKQ